MRTGSALTKEKPASAVVFDLHQYFGDEDSVLRHREHVRSSAHSKQHTTGHCACNAQPRDRAHSRPAVKEHLPEHATESRPSNPEEAQKFYAVGFARWSRVVTRAVLKDSE